jgi:hypothetical protein
VPVISLAFFAGVRSVTTLKEFEDALREHGMNMALAILQKLRDRDRANRSIAPARRITGCKMTPDLARQILDLHATTGMTQQEIAFKLGVNQGRVNEVIKRGKWLHDDPNAPEAVARDRAKARMAGKGRKATSERRSDKAPAAAVRQKRHQPEAERQTRLALEDL